MSRDLYNKKWRKFLGRIWPFRFIPFVDFVLAAGSLATGNMREESDFDVIVGVRQGRIFSVRAFCILAFGMFGWRAVHKMRPKPTNPPESTKRIRIFGFHSGHSDYSGSSDCVCFNHFVTPAAYRLSLPHNDYWNNLYQKLVPVYGSPEAIQRFYDANADWLGKRRIYKDDPRHKYKKSGWVKKLGEWILSERSGSNIRTKGWLGDWLESKLKAVQIKRIKRGLESQAGYKPRIIYNDNELEFHPDTKRMELFLKDN